MTRTVATGLFVLAAALLAAAAWLQQGAQETPALLAGLAGGLLAAGGALALGPLTGAAGTALFGALVSYNLTLAHHEAVHGGTSACNLNETFNCDLVNTSQFSELGGVPIALFGLAFYAAIGVVAALGWRKVVGYDRAAGLVLVAGLVGSGVSALLALASLSLGAWCILCISTYVANGLLLLAGLRGTQDRVAEAGAALLGAKDRSMATALVVGLAALFLGWSHVQGLGTGSQVVQQLSEGAPDAELNLGMLYERPVGVLNLSGAEPAWGKPDAPVTVVEFADYQCPYCALMAKQLKAVAARAPELRVVYKHYALSNLCNSKVPSVGHDQACAAAAAAVCAQQQGRFWEMNEQMFANQEVLEPGNISFIARKLGLDMTAFEGCQQNPATMERVKQDIAHGHEVGVNSTPSLYVQGLLADPGAWVKVTQGSEGLELLLKARRDGVALPPAGPPGSTESH